MALKRYVAPILLLLVIVAFMEWLPTRLPGREAALERDSERLGWTPAIESDEVARDVFDRVNDERTERGLPRLVWHDGLADLARRWSEEMIATGYRHSTGEWRFHPDFAGSGENIFMGPRSARELHIGWMRSAGHRDNILYPGYTAIGIGVVCRNDGRMWATQIFGVPHGSFAPPPTETDRNPLVRRDEGTMCRDAGTLMY